jgi:hypothetical protein
LGMIAPSNPNRATGGDDHCSSRYRSADASTTAQPPAWQGDLQAPRWTLVRARRLAPALTRVPCPLPRRIERGACVDCFPAHAAFPEWPGGVGVRIVTFEASARARRNQIILMQLICKPVRSRSAIRLGCSNSSSTPSLSAGVWDKTPLPAHSPIFLFNLPLLRHV